uniref:Uncharacterized protein n=3 Tax=Clastoptera arizonana TaxID=38151 RepID=A0A1B6DVS3_9HEMI
MYGAVQQENRLSKAVDVILRHVENLKQAYDKEKTEHEDARRLLVENKSPAAILKLNQSTKRRASIATVPRSQTNPDTTKSMSSPAEVKGGRTRLNSIPRRISDVISEAEHSKEHASEEQSKEQKENKEQTDVQKTSPNNTTSLNSIRLTIRKPSGIIEDPSHAGETESEDEQDLEGLGKERMSLTKSDSRLSFFSHRYNSSYNRRSSLKCSWMNKLTSHIHWIQPVDQLLLQVRYGVAAMLLIAAVGVFTSAFFLPNNR